MAYTPTPIAAAARGSDILFLEALLERGGDSRVILPFRIKDYKEISVGGDWNRQFDEILKNENHVELIAPEEDAPKALSDLQAAFAEANRAIYSEASSFARGLDQEPSMLVVWDGKTEGDGPGGTADALKFRRARGQRDTVDVIPLDAPLGKGAPGRYPPEDISTLDPRQVTSAEEISEEMRVSQSFDAGASAGLFLGVRQFSRDFFSEVAFAVDDAVDLAHLFAMELRLMEPKNVVLALSGEPQKLVSKKRLEKLLAMGAARKQATFTEVIDEIGKLRVKTEKEGIAVVSTATHGFSDQGRDYLVASDSVRARVVTTGIPVSILFDDISSAKAERRLLLLDACREPVSKDTRALDALGEDGQAVMSEELSRAIGKASGMAVLSGTTKGGFSYDDVRAQNGVFTKAILDGLGGMAPTVDGFITVSSLADYAQERVQSWVAKYRPEHQHVSRGISRGIEGRAAQMPLASVRPSAEIKKA